MLHLLFLVFCASPGLGMPNMMQENKYIIGGQNTNISEVPYTAVLLSNGRFICGATIISEKYLLTAAHCVRQQSTYTVRVGSSYSEKDGVVHSLKKVVMHPLYSRDPTDYDAACLEVEDPIEFNSNVQPIPVTDEEPNGGEIAKLSGYGRNSKETLPEQLQSTELIVLNRKSCNKIYHVITPRMICTISKNFDTCSYKGDSGGPLVVDGKVVGSVSWGMALAPCSSPSAYASFGNPDIRAFIRENTGI